MFTPAQRKKCKQQAHHLKPVVLIGQAGLSNQVHEAIQEALDAHEMIKIKIPPMDSAQKKLCAEKISAHHQAELIQTIGRTVTLYRKKPEQS